MSAERFVSDRLMSRRRLISAIERVEPRQLLATLVGTDLRIEGTAGNDRVRVETIGANVVVTQNAVAQSFNKTKVKTINANLRNGNDRIDIIWNVVATTTISGEGGHDTVIGGDYKDVIYTGSGNDFVYSGRGGDFIQTSTGNDFISPGSQNDTVDAGDGQDEVSYADRATAINGQLNVRAYYDTPSNSDFSSRGSMTAGAESDAFSGVETLTGGKGNDTLSLMVTGTPDSPFRENTFRINGGDGDDSLGGSSWYDAVPRWMVRMVADGGNGADRLNFYVTNAATLIGGAGNDEFYSVDTDASVPTIDAGAGIDSFTFGRIGPSVTMPPGLENLTIQLIAGNTVVAVGNELANTIRVLASGSNVNVDGRGGDDLIRVDESQGLRSTLIGGSGNDTIRGSPGNDSIRAGDGNDLLQPGLGNDTVDAGDGQDEVSYGDRSTPIDIRFWHAIYRQQMTFENMSRATVTGSGENDEIINLETATLSRGNDRFDLTGDLDDSYPWNGALLNQIYRINTGEGDDVGGVGTGPSFSGSSGSVHQMVIDGGNGNDGFSTWPGYSTTIIGGAGNDTLEVTWDEGDVPVYLPGAGVDWINLGGKHSSITMQPELENVSIFSDVAGREPLDVNVVGNDLDNTILVGRAGGMTVTGGRGNDLIRAQGQGGPWGIQAPRFLDGGAGNDTIYGSGFNDSILGGSGNDVVDLRGVTLYQDPLARWVDGGDGNDTLFGSPYAEVLKGGAGNDSIDGGAGADSIYGGTGTDRAKRDSADAIVDSIEVFV